MNNELKVSFYLKRESRLEKNSVGENVAYPITGKIIIGNSIVQFATKLKVEERLWHVKSGRATGKSRLAVELNREINKINLSIHAHYKEILDRTASTYKGYRTTYKYLEQFLRKKYKVSDIPLIRLDLPFIEAFDFYLRVERGLKPASMLTNVIYLQKAARIALHRNLISRLPFTGYKPEKPELQTRSLTKDELERFISTPLPKSRLCYIRDLFVFCAFTGISYADLKKLTWKDVIKEKDGSLWISASRQKTGIPFNVKLLDIPLRIIEKYRGCAKENHLFRVQTSTTLNNALKKSPCIAESKRAFAGT